MKDTIMNRIISSLILSAAILIPAASSAQDLQPGQYYTAPGRTVIEVPVPNGVVLDDHGCAYIEENKYMCFAGQMANQVFTSKAEALAAWRFIINPSSRYSALQLTNMKEAGRALPGRR